MSTVSRQIAVPCSYNTSVDPTVCFENYHKMTVMYCDNQVLILNLLCSIFHRTDATRACRVCNLHLHHNQGEY